MPRKSQTENVRKICGCAKWKTCAHPWYLDYQRDKVRYRDNLDKLIGRHAADYTEAKDEARRAIVAKLEGRDPKGLVPSDDPTLAQMLAEYQRAKPQRDRWQIGRIAATAVGGRPFGEWRLSAITHDALTEFQESRPLVAGNRDLALLRTAFRWAVVKGLLDGSPFKVGNVSVVSLKREDARTRRLYPGEQERLLEAAGGLHDLILAALETACRKGELLSLQWWQVRFTPKAEIFLPAGKTKAKKDRRIPISAVLLPVLARRQHDPAGEPVPQDGYVFGDEIGRRRHSIKTAWKLTLKRAKITGLHFHDLRREAASRWLDSGRVSLAQIQQWLGHHDISQTSTYLGASLGADEAAMRAFDASRGLTQIDVFGGSKRQNPTQSDTGTSEKPNEISIGHDPAGTIH